MASESLDFEPRIRTAIEEYNSSIALADGILYAPVYKGYYALVGLMGSDMCNWITCKDKTPTSSLGPFSCGLYVLSHRCLHPNIPHDILWTGLLLKSNQIVQSR